MQTIMATYSGGPFNVLEPRASDIRLLDIAESLSKINRYSGHTVRPYSVAQHSVIVSKLLEGSGYEMEGLLHDAAEAYTGDITSPVKAALRKLAEFDVIEALEEPIQTAIAQRFGLHYPFDSQVHDADREALAFEKRCVLHPTAGVPWGSFDVPSQRLDMMMIPVITQEEARDAFLQRYQILSLQRAINLREAVVGYQS